MLSFSCATAPSIRKYVGPIRNARGQVHGFGSFSALWEEWTVQFGATDREERLGVSSPLTVVGGHIDEFPLGIAATLMDSLLIESGLQHYATLLAMTPEGQANFHRAYCKWYAPANHLLIWCELQTIWAENYMDPQRWIIFLEDDAGNQYVPERILQGSQPIRQVKVYSLAATRAGWGPRGWDTYKRALMLCFSRYSFQGLPILSKKVRSLKLVFQLQEDVKVKAIGTWLFKK